MKYIKILFLTGLFLITVLPSALAQTTGSYPAYSGQKKIAVIMLNWSDRSCPATRQQVVDRIWNSSGSVRKYYLAMSRNLLDFIPPAGSAADGTVPVTTSAVYGPYTLSIAAGFDKDVTYANADDLYGGKYLDGVMPVARTLAAADGFNASNYNYVMYVSPKTDTTGSLGGWATLGGNTSFLFDFRQNYINHEIGHNLKLQHSNTTFNVGGYGSQDCVMGNAVNTHLDGPHSYFMGWYPDSCFPVRSYGQYEIENLAQQNSDNAKVLRFDRGAHGATNYPTYNLWIEYRVKGIGYDNVLHSDWDKKVNIHYCEPRSMRPTDAPLAAIYNNNVSKFAIGGSYTEPDNKCKVLFLRSTSTHATVQLIDPSGNQPPSIADQSFVVQGGTTNFTVLANDPENNPLTYTIISGPSVGSLSNSGSTFTYTGSTIGTYPCIVRVNDGQYDSFDATLTIKVEFNNPPVAFGQSVKVYYNTPRSITLTASDADPADTLSYFVVANPTKGTLSGAPPNLTYTPNLAYVGADSFTFRANDGMDDSNLAAVSLSVLGTPNSPPVVFAGLDQSVPLGGVDVPWTPAQIATVAWYDADDAGTLWSDTGGTIPATSAVARWNDKSGNGRHATQGTAGNMPTYSSADRSLTGNATLTLTLGDTFYTNLTSGALVFAGKQNVGGSGWGNYGQSNNIHTPWTDNRMYSSFMIGSRVSTTTTVSGLVGTASVQSQAHNGTNLEILSDGLSLYNAANAYDNTPTETRLFGENNSYTLYEVLFLPNADVETRQKVEGYLAHKWGTVTRLVLGHPYKATAPVTSGPGAQVILADASVSDPNNDPLTATWTVVSQPEGSTVTISNASALNTTANFSAVGSYTFRLTANDASTSISDDVVISVEENQVTAYQQWLIQSGLGEGEQSAFDADANSDGIANGMGWLLGAENANDNAHEFLPQSLESGGDLSLSFKMLRSEQRGSAVLYLQYSSDLGSIDPWSNNTIQVPDESGTVNGVEFVIIPIDGRNHNEVQVTIPASAAGGVGKIFARLQGILNPDG